MPSRISLSGRGGGWRTPTRPLESHGTLSPLAVDVNPSLLSSAPWFRKKKTPELTRAFFLRVSSDCLVGALSQIGGNRDGDV